jgi:nucleoside-diphosphate-sugar epimerase
MAGRSRKGKRAHRAKTMRRKQKGGTYKDFYVGKNVLVTGGAGFIGSHIVDALLANGVAKVRVLDSLDEGSHGKLTDEQKSMPKNLVEANATGKLEFMKGDIRDLETCKQACKDMNVVFHEAAMVSVPKSMDEPIKNHETNITGTLNMLIAAAGAGVSRFVYASSAATYGSEPTLPKKETMQREYPSPYALSKGVDEDYANLWASKNELGKGMTCIGLRYFNVYGPRQNPSSTYSGVISIFADKLIEKEKITIYGDGQQTRDFVFVKDVVHANLLAGSHPLPVTESRETQSRVFNVGTGKSVTLLELLETMKSIWGRKKPNVVHKNVREGNIRDSQSNISAISTELGYAPQYTLAEGLQALFDSL